MASDNQTAATVLEAEVIRLTLSQDGTVTRCTHANWQDCPVLPEGGEDLPPATLLLVKTERMEHSHLTLPFGFVQAHRERSVLPTGGVSFLESVLNAKWLSRGFMRGHAWNMDREIDRSDGSAADADGWMYKRLGLYRSYYSLQARSFESVFADGLDQYTQVAACKAMSFFYTTINGIIFFDPDRQHLAQKLVAGTRENPTPDMIIITHVHKFPPGSPRDWIAERVQLDSHRGEKGHSHLGTGISLLILEHVTNETLDILSSLCQALADIESNLSNDAVLQTSLQDYRHFLSYWKRELFDLDSLFTYMHGKVDLDGADGSFLKKNRYLQRLLEMTTKRLDVLHQSMMSSMSIIDSKKAILEAENVSKLTQLAFFFVPLTLVSGIFGMNVVEFENHLTTWLWVAVSAVTMFLSYLYLYWHNISRAFGRAIMAAETALGDWGYLLTAFLLPTTNAGVGLGMWKILGLGYLDFPFKTMFIGLLAAAGIVLNYILARITWKGLPGSLRRYFVSVEYDDSTRVTRPSTYVD